LANILPLYTTGLDSGIIVDCGFIHTSISVVCQTIFSLQGNQHFYIGSSNLEYKLRELLKEDNKDHEDKISSKIVQQVLCK